MYSHAHATSLGSAPLGSHRCGLGCGMSNFNTNDTNDTNDTYDLQYTILQTYIYIYIYVYYFISTIQTMKSLL